MPSGLQLPRGWRTAALLSRAPADVDDFITTHNNLTVGSRGLKDECSSLKGLESFKV